MPDDHHQRQPKEEEYRWNQSDNSLVFLFHIYDNFVMMILMLTDSVIDIQQLYVLFLLFLLRPNSMPVGDINNYPFSCYHYFFFSGDPIDCWVNIILFLIYIIFLLVNQVPAQFKPSYEAYTDSYCWIANTYCKKNKIELFLKEINFFRYSN